MELATLGRTGLRVSRLAAGGLFLSDLGGPFEDSKDALERALAGGVNYIDTAPRYFNSEQVLGDILGERANGLILSTKLGGRPEPFDPKDKAGLVGSLKESLRLLHRDYIDILMVHEPDRPAQFDWWDDKDAFTGPVTEALEELKRDGLIRFTGAGGTTAHELARVCESGRFDVVLAASNYSLLWQEARYEVFPAAKRHNMGIISATPLQQGALAVRYDDLIAHGAPWLSLPRRQQYRALYGLLDETGIPIAELALRFVLSNPDVHCVLNGFRNADECAQNLAAAEKGPLPPDILDEIERIYRLVPFRPSLEPFGLPFSRPYDGPGEFA